jgi:hypothetical protein
MKKSRRLIRNTILALNGLMVLYVGINRLYAVDETTHAPRRTDAAELARLRDFNAIEVHGDFGLDVVQEAGYSVGLPPPGRSKGEFVAIVRGNTLVLNGYRHTHTTRVRVGMPALTHLEAGEEVPALTVSGFNGASLSLRLEGKSRVVLRNNAIRQWHISASQIGELQIDKASLGAGKVDLAGRATLSVID